MSSSDIKPRGAGEGKYWVKRPPAMGGVGTLRLVVIDEFGRVESTPLGMPWDDAAMTEDEAIQHHLRGAVAEADRLLEQRRREAPPQSVPALRALDRPTRRFLDDDTIAIDLTGRS